MCVCLQSTCDEDCEPVVGVVDTQEQATQSPDPATPDTPETPATHTTSSPAQTNNILTRSRVSHKLYPHVLASSKYTNRVGIEMAILGLRSQHTR